MPPRSARTPVADPPELSHRDIIRSVESLRQHVDQGFTALNVRADERHKSTSDRLDRIEERLDKHTRAIGQLEGDVDGLGPLKAAAASVEPPREDGISFKKGWARKLALTVMALTGLAALKAALAAMDAVGHAIGAAWHTLTTH